MRPIFQSLNAIQLIEFSVDVADVVVVLETLVVSWPPPHMCRPLAKLCNVQCDQSTHIWIYDYSLSKMFFGKVQVKERSKLVILEVRQ